MINLAKEFSTCRGFDPCVSALLTDRITYILIAYLHNDTLRATTRRRRIQKVQADINRFYKKCAALIYLFKILRKVSFVKYLQNVFEKFDQTVLAYFTHHTYDSNIISQTSQKHSIT